IAIALLGREQALRKIPLGLFKCKELEYISLADNRLEGILPKEIGNLTMLRSLYLDNNLFEALLGREQALRKNSIGLFKCKELVFISLADNRLEGILPKEIGNLTMLRNLYLYNNLFEGKRKAGEIPSNMFDHLSRLQVLYLGKNNPSGKIPLGLFKCKELEDISLADNRLEGILPKEIGNLTILRSLYLDNNLFEGKRKAARCYFNLLSFSDCNICFVW
ncbi:hypothetical protein Gotur_001833, partial [Gossypium turneri]